MAYIFLPPTKISDFHGEDVDGWLYQIERFFDHYQMAPDQKLAVIHNYLTGEAREWHYEMYMNWRLTTWESFVTDFRHRFKPPEALTNKQEVIYEVDESAPTVVKSITVEVTVDFDVAKDRVTDDTPEVVVREELVVAKEAYDDDFISVVHRPSTLDESLVIDVTAREVTSFCLSLLSVSQTFVIVKETVKLEFGAPTDVLQRRLSVYSSSGVCQNVTETFHCCSNMQCGLNAYQCILFDWKYVQLMLAWYMRLFDFSIVLRIGENDQVVQIWELLTWTFQRITWLGKESCISQIYSHWPHMMIVWNGILRILCWFGKLEELVQWYLGSINLIIVLRPEEHFHCDVPNKQEVNRQQLSFLCVSRLKYPSTMVWFWILTYIQGVTTVNAKKRIDSRVLVTMIIFLHTNRQWVPEHGFLAVMLLDGSNMAEEINNHWNVLFASRSKPVIKARHLSFPLCDIHPYDVPNSWLEVDVSDACKNFLEANKRDVQDGTSRQTLLCFRPQDFSIGVILKLTGCVFVNVLQNANLDQADEVFDAISRCFSFVFMRIMAKALLLPLEMPSPAELCNWHIESAEKCKLLSTYIELNVDELIVYHVQQTFRLLQLTSQIAPTLYDICMIVVINPSYSSLPELFTCSTYKVATVCASKIRADEAELPCINYGSFSVDNGHLIPDMFASAAAIFQSGADFNKVDFDFSVGYGEREQLNEYLFNFDVMFFNCTVESSCDGMKLFSRSRTTNSFEKICHSSCMLYLIIDKFSPIMSTTDTKIYNFGTATRMTPTAFDGCFEAVLYSFELDEDCIGILSNRSTLILLYLTKFAVVRITEWATCYGKKQSLRDLIFLLLVYTTTHDWQNSNLVFLFGSLLLVHLVSVKHLHANLLDWYEAGKAEECVIKWLILELNYENKVTEGSGGDAYLIYIGLKEEIGWMMNSAELAMNILEIITLHGGILVKFIADDASASQVIEREVEAVPELLQTLAIVEKFYSRIGCIIVYQIVVFKLPGQSIFDMLSDYWSLQPNEIRQCKVMEIHSVVEFDFSQRNEYAFEATLWGRSNCRLFEQPLVLDVTAQGRQGIVTKPIIYLCKSGAHGVDRMLDEEAADFAFILRRISIFFMFSLPRPPEIANLEDKVEIMGGGMLRAYKKICLIGRVYYLKPCLSTNGHYR